MPDIYGDRKTKLDQIKNWNKRPAPQKDRLSEALKDDPDDLAAWERLKQTDFYEIAKRLGKLKE